ncbi:MAG TPA: hypothetical protein VFU98_05140 [Microlunatus sp.]|nr:hypothetical protein [Microlunatus sp.]
MQSKPQLSSSPGFDDISCSFAAFIACRTTLEDLSERTAAIGEQVSGSTIAAHLTGQATVSDVTHNAVADAINTRLQELSLAAAAPYRSSRTSRADVTR